MFHTTPILVRAHAGFLLNSGTCGIRRLFVVAAAYFVMPLVVVGAPMTALADDPKPYGPIAGDDFTMDPPNPRPKDEDGNPLRAEITTTIALDPEVSSTHKSETAGGAITITTTAKPKVSTEMLKDKSWIDPELKNDKDLIDHEKGHLDVTEKHTRELQAQLDRKQKDGEFTETKVLPPGTSDADRDKAIDEQQARVQKKIDDLWAAKKKMAEDENKKYDDATDHGKGQAQAEVRAAQIAALKSPNTIPDQKTAVDLKSKSGQSIKFNPLTGQLTIDEDFVIGIDPLNSGFVVDPLDPVLGSLVVLPVFSMLGVQGDGSFFFGALGADPRVEIVSAGGEQLFTAILPYLVYDPAINLLYGLGGAFEALGGASAYVDRLSTELTDEDLALFGIEFRPDVDFGEASLGFTVDAISSFTNSAGARDLRLVPEPATSSLFGLCMLLLGLTMWRRTKQVVR